MIGTQCVPRNHVLTQYENWVSWPRSSTDRTVGYGPADGGSNPSEVTKNN